MKIKHVSQNWLSKQIKKILSQHLDSSYKAFYFGSRVRGDNFARADIDIGIQGPQPIPPEKKIALQEELEKLPILYKIDFVDFATASNSFKKEALKYQEKI